MANRNEAKIKFTAETGEFNDAIKKANDEMSQLRAEFKLNETQMQSTGATVEGLEKRHSLLVSQLAASESKTEALSAKVAKAVEIYGENSAEVTKLKTQLANAQAAEERIRQAIDKCNSEIEQQANASEEAQSATAQLTKKIEDQQREVSELQQEYTEAVLKYGKTSKEAKSLSKQIDDLTGELSENKSKMQDAEYAAKDLDESLDKVDGSADKLGGTLEKLGGGIATGVVAGLGAIAAAGASAVAALTECTVGGAAYADEMLTLSTQTGISTENLQAFSYASELVDVDLETLTKSMAKNIKSMQSAQLGSARYADAYKELGVSVTDANGNLRDGETVYWEAIDALGKMSNETERDAIAMQLFGKSAQELNPLIEAGAGQMQELTKEAKEVGAVLSEDSLEAFGAFDDSLQRLKGSASASKNALGAVLLPELKLLTDSGTDLITTFNTKLNASGGGLSGLVSVIGEMSGEISQTAGKLLGTFANAAVQIVPSLISVIGDLAVTLATTVVSQIGKVAPSAIGALVGLVNSLISALPSLVQSIVSALPSLLPALISGFVSIVVTLCSQFSNIIQPIIDELPNIVISVVSALTQNLPILIDGMITLTLGLVAALPQICQALVVALPSAVEMIVTALLRCIPQLISGFVSLIKGVAAAKNQIFSSMKQAFVGAIEGIWNGIKNVFSGAPAWFGEKFRSAKDTMTKAFSNLKEKLTAPFEKARDAIKGVVDKIKGFFSGLKLKLPKIKLPHFKITGSFSLSPPSVPKLKIDWYGKAMSSPMILNSPTIFGHANGRFLGGGETGSEMIGGTNTVMEMIQSAVDRSMQAMNINALAAAVEELASRPIELYINGRRFALATAGDSDRVNGMRNRIIERGVLLD